MFDLKTSPCRELAVIVRVFVSRSVFTIIMGTKPPHKEGKETS